MKTPSHPPQIVLLADEFDVSRSMYWSGLAWLIAASHLVAAGLQGHGNTDFLLSVTISERKLYCQA
jgi:hypothetical protein